MRNWLLEDVRASRGDRNSIQSNWKAVHIVVEAYNIYIVFASVSSRIIPWN